MGVTGTVHPPAGATALMCATDQGVVDMGWMFVGIVVLGSVLLVVVALVVDNLQRTFPVYWWSARKVEVVGDEEKGESEVEKMDEGRVVIEGDRVLVPSWLNLGSEEITVLEGIRERMRDLAGRRGSEATRVGGSVNESVSGNSNIKNT